MKNIEQVDMMIREFSTESAYPIGMSKLLFLLGERVRLIQGEVVGTRSFQDYLKLLDISDNDMQRVVKLRNQLAHKNEVSRIDWKWLLNVIVPKALAMKSEMIDDVDWLEKVWVELGKIFDRIDYQIIDLHHIDNIVFPITSKYDMVIHVPERRRVIIVELKSAMKDLFSARSNMYQALLLADRRYGAILTTGKEAKYYINRNSGPHLHLFILGVDQSDWVEKFQNWAHGDRNFFKSVEIKDIE